MNPKKLSDCIENSDNRLVQQAQQIPNYAQQHRKKRLRSWTAIAACFALMACSFCIGAFAFARERVVEVPIEQESLTIETLGLTLILPNSWKGRCALEQSEFSKVYQVYNPAIRKALIGGDEGQTGGVLFYIRCWDEQLTKEQVDAGVYHDDQRRHLSPVLCQRCAMHAGNDGGISPDGKRDWRYSFCSR